MKKTYFHSVSGLRLPPSDSSLINEEDFNLDFINDTETAAINELTDINSTEKRFMILWNTFINKSNQVSATVLETCLSFLDSNFTELQEMKYQWCLHLLTLKEYNCLTADDMLLIQLNFTSKRNNI